jgi:fatty-acyl-CoA synthase
MFQAGCNLLARLFPARYNLSLRVDPATFSLDLHGDSTSTIVERVLALAAADPDRVFCHFKAGANTQEISYGELIRAAGAYASHYKRSNVKQGDVVAIVLRHCPDLFYSFIGALMRGAIPTILPFPTVKQDPDLYWRGHSELFRRSGVGMVVTFEDNLAGMDRHLPGLTIPLATVEALQPSVLSSRDEPRCESGSRGVAFLQHSSGTTGLKKGVALSDRAVLEQVRSYSSALSLEASDVFVTWLPLYHDMGLIACFIMPLLLGIPVVAIDPFEWVARPTILFDAVQEYRGTHAWLPNFAFHLLARAADESATWDLSSVKALIDCSEPCKPSTFQMFAERFAAMGVGLEKLQVCYAMAETVFAVTQTRPGRRVGVRREVLSCGEPIANIEVRIAGNEGEIAVRGSFLFDGYFKLPEETRRKIRDGWYYTGDYGFLCDGELYVAGRADDLIIAYGRNFYAHDIEFAANTATGVIPGRCVAVGVYNEQSGTEDVTLIAEIQPGADPDLVRSEIKDAISRRVGLTLQKAVAVEPGWLIKTTSGKISRIENLKKYVAMQG